MQVTLNFEAPAYRDSTGLVNALTALFLTPVVKLRPARAAYIGPDGLVVARNWVAYLDSPLPTDGVASAAFRLADGLAQDCVAIEYDGAQTLIGPRADKWLPFNPAYFTRY